MQTNFTPEQLLEPKIREADKILRTCVHCGFCTATCPTFVLLGDELDSPRGRIYLIKDMLENGRAADERTVRHVDRCLSCLSCMTTCPSGVDYMHLVDQAREHIENTYERPFMDRALRAVLGYVLPRPGLFRLALLGAWLGKPFAGALPARFKAMLSLAPSRIPLLPSADDRPGTSPAQGTRRMRVAMLQGCAQKVLDPAINAATIRLLTRLGCEVVVARDAGCCGALTLHMGKTDSAKALAARTIDAWVAELDGPGLDAVVINASGCGTTVKDYAHLFQDDPAMAEKAARIAKITLDVTELVERLGVPADARPAQPLKVAYHSACSMQHGQKIKTLPQKLLRAAGFTVVEPLESHICCGSAGTYNLLQPELAGKLKERKVGNIERLNPSVIATGNIGCMTQIGSGTRIPVLHTVELLDWATGGPVPAKLQSVLASQPMSEAA